MKNLFLRQLQLACIGGGVLHRHCVDFCPKCIDGSGQEIVEEHGSQWRACKHLRRAKRCL